MPSSPQNAAVPRVVIIGGGFGGITAARALNGMPVRVTMIDKTNHHVFQPLLYQVATAGLSPADIAAPIRHIVRKQKNTDVLMAEVTGIDTVAKTVQIAEHEPLPYDYLIMATGARHSYFGKEQWDQNAPGLKTLTDATRIRERVLSAFELAETAEDERTRREFLTFVIVGGGPTGAEMAGAISELAKRALASDFRHIDPRSAKILLIEAGPRILSGFPEYLAKRAQHALEKMGVEVRTGNAVQDIDDSGVTVAYERIGCHTVIWAAGVLASPAGQWFDAPTDKNRRVLVNPDLSVPGHPEIFVIGDTMTLIQDGKPLPGVAPVAMQQGPYVANAIRSSVFHRDPPPPFRYRDKGNLATIGRKYAIADFGKFGISGFPAWLLWLGIHIYFLIGFRNRFFVLAQWAWAYLTYERGARLITSRKEGERGTEGQGEKKPML